MDCNEAIAKIDPIVFSTQQQQHSTYSVIVSELVLCIQFSCEP